MKKFYRKIIKLLNSVIVWIEIKKAHLFEIINIIKKRKLYSNIKWTKEQKKQFNDYWKRVYGRKISNRWHRLYQSINGEFCVEYFPDILFSTKLEHKKNSYSYSKVLSDKILLETLYSGKIEGVRTPHTYILSYANMIFNKKRDPISIADIGELLYDIGNVVLKPTVDTSSGRGIKILEIEKGYDKASGNNVSEIIGKYKTNFIIQEKIEPHKIFEKIYPKAINTLRVITYTTRNGIKTAPICLRVGSGGGVVDNIHAGGMVVGVTDNGVCLDKAYVLGNCDNKAYYTKHPDTGVVFEGYELPMIPKIIDVAKTLHKMTVNIDMISWDFAVDSKGDIIVIEANNRGQSIWFPQIVHKRSLFGDDTEEMLDLIK